MSEFLDDLKNSLEKGIFNSEAAKKIIEVNKLADEKVGSTKALDELNNNANIQNVNEEEALAINSEYEKKMSDIKKQDTANQVMATVVDIEDMVKLSISDMMSYIDEVDEKFNTEFDKEHPAFGELYLKVQSIKSTYNPIINK